MAPSLSRKSMFLSFIALMLISAFIVLFSIGELNIVPDPSIEHAFTLNAFVEDMEGAYFPSTIEASGTRAIMSLISYMDIQDEFLTEFEGPFLEVMQNGTLSGVSIDALTGQNLMQNQTFLQWMDSIDESATELYDARLNVTIRGMSVYQRDPWYLLVETNLSYDISAQAASWHKNNTIYTRISLDRFEDPYLLINSHGAIGSHRINRTAISKWNTSNTQEHVQHGTYAYFATAQSPSFMDRFINSTEPSLCCGIESILDPNYPSIGDTMLSYVDYLYYSKSITDCTLLYNLTWGAYDNLKLDASRIFLYNLTPADYVRSC